MHHARNLHVDVICVLAGGHQWDFIAANPFADHVQLLHRLRLRDAGHSQVVAVHLVPRELRVETLSAD